MAEEEAQVVTLTDDFYRDSFPKIVIILGLFCIAFLLLLAASIYLVVSKPDPRTFAVGEEWRVQPPVPVSEPYLSTADLLQWVADVLPRSLDYDFVDYNEQLKDASKNFTADGWKVFLNQLNNYVNYNKVQSDRLFVRATPQGAPFLLNQGIILGRYGWWVQMPILIEYTGNEREEPRRLTLQILVVRVPTTNNLNGVGIDNVIVAKDPRSAELEIERKT